GTYSDMMSTDGPSPEATAASPLEPRKWRSTRSRAPRTMPPGSSVPSIGEPPTHAEIAELAYRLWMERGEPMGSPEIDWERAEQMLLDDPRTPPNGPTPKAA